MDMKYKKFTTTDGLTLELDVINNEWTDGDSTYDSNESGLPIDANQQPLKGKLSTLSSCEVAAKMVSQINSAKRELSSMVAKTTIEAVREKTCTSDLLQLIGSLTDQDLSAIDLLIEIRKELSK